MTHSGGFVIKFHLNKINIVETSRVEGEGQGYLLHIGGFKGTAGHSMSYHNGMKFTTLDRDNDKSRVNCAQYYKGGWWINQ